MNGSVNFWWDKRLHSLFVDILNIPSHMHKDSKASVFYFWANDAWNLPESFRFLFTDLADQISQVVIPLDKGIDKVFFGKLFLIEVSLAKMLSCSSSRKLMLLAGLIWEKEG